jgi:hypothetical protein
LKFLLNFFSVNDVFVILRAFFDKAHSNISSTEFQVGIWEALAREKRYKDIQDEERA